jgi:hypothetical protein
MPTNRTGSKRTPGTNRALPATLKLDLDPLAVLEDNIRDRADVTFKLKEIEEAKDHLDRMIVAAMQARAERGERTLIVEDTNRVIQATFTQTEQTFLDEDKLKAQIGARRFNKYLKERTVVEFDQDAFQADVKAGVISAADALAAIETKMGKPYVRHTVKAKKD